MKQIPHIILNDCDARQRIAAGIKYHMKDKAQWLPAYDQVAQWFADNRGRGLICTGTCGLGKSLICRDILPQLFKIHYGNKLETYTVSATDMPPRIDKLLDFCAYSHIIVIDDLGTEPVEAWIDYRKRNPFCELVDKAERTGTMLIITTNLFTTIPRLKTDCAYGKAGDLVPSLHPSIEERYGIRTLDRLRAITSVVLFQGKSLRNAL